MEVIKVTGVKYWVYGLATLFLFFIYLAGLRFDLVVDAGKYAAISKHVHESGDLIRLKIFGEPYDQKPPFMFWLGALSFRLFGVSNVSFKLPTLLFTLFGTYATFRLGKSLYNKKTGKLAALMLFASQSMLLYNNDTHTDVILTMCIVIALWQLNKFIRKKNWWNYFAGFVFVGFAMITKGPIGLAVPVFAIVSHLLVTKDYKMLWPQIWLPGLLVVAAIVTPALIGLYQQFGAEGIKFFFWTNNVGRITGTYTGSSNDFAFYLHTAGYLLLPFSILTYFGAFHEIKSWVLNRFSFKNAQEGFTLAIPVFLAILSVSKMKSPHYMLPVIPLIAIFTAKWAVKLIRGKVFSAKLTKAMVIAQNAAAVLLVAGSLIIPVVFFPTASLWFWAPVAALIGATVYVGLKSVKTSEQLVNVPIMAIILVNLILTVHFLPHVFKYNATPIASRDFNKAGSADATLFVMMGAPDYEAGFYAKNYPRSVDAGTLAKLETVQEPWVYADRAGKAELFEKYPGAEIFKQYKYRRISKISLNFLMPNKRNGELDDMYLIKVK